MKILIADDHNMFREGLKRILQEEAGIQDIGEADSSATLLNMLDEKDWNIVLLDINMPGRSGIDILKEIKVSHPRIPVLILSMYPEDQYTIRAIKAGASGYLTKASASDELVKVIHHIVAGRKFISPTLAEKLAEAVGDGPEGTIHDKLSDREFLVLRLIGRGMTVGEIAKELSLSVKTISTYRSKILEKMDMKNNADLMQYVLQNGLAE